MLTTFLLLAQIAAAPTYECAVRQYDPPTRDSVIYCTATGPDHSLPPTFSFTCQHCQLSGPVRDMSWVFSAKGDPPGSMLGGGPSQEDCNDERRQFRHDHPAVKLGTCGTMFFPGH